MGELAAVIMLSYIVGSIPTSIIVGKFTHGVDVRNFGSGNAGGTNVFRVLGWKYGVFVILVDIFKGYVATMLITKLMFGPIPFQNRTPFEDITVVRIIAGCAAILGHIWTVFASFKGGKGIATAGGVLLALATIEVLVTLAIFAVVFAITRYVSLGSVIAAVTFPLTMVLRHNIFHGYLEGYHTLIFFSIGISILLIYTHRTNIKRLIAGTEHRLTTSALFKRTKKYAGKS